jgi:hypothetical protein
MGGRAHISIRTVNSQTENALSGLSLKKRPPRRPFARPLLIRLRPGKQSHRHEHPFCRSLPHRAHNQDKRFNMSAICPVRTEAVPPTPPGGVNSLFLRFLVFKVMIKNYLHKKRRKISTAKGLGKHCFWCKIRPVMRENGPKMGAGLKSNFLTPFDPLFRGTAIVAPL